MNKWLIVTLVSFFLIGLLACTQRGFSQMFTKPRPTDFFAGEQLEVARAIKSRDVERIRDLASQLPDIDAPGLHPPNLLAFAVNDDNPPAIKVLMELGADPAVYTESRGTIGYQAMTNKTTTSLKALLEAGMDPNIPHSNGDSPPLIFAAPNLPAPDVEGNDSLKLLVEYGADVNARDSLGNTPLILMTITKFDEALYLMDHGADVHAMSKSGKTVAYAIQARLDDMDKKSEAYQKMLKIKDKAEAMGVQFPALSQWAERWRNDIVRCAKPGGWRPRSQCEQVGVDTSYPNYLKNHKLKQRDEQILKDRYGIDHQFE